MYLSILISVQDFAFPAGVFALPSNQPLERPTHMKPTFTTKKQTMNQTL